MRIVHLSEYALPYRGGGQMYLDQISRRTASAGHDVSIITNRLDGSPDSQTLDGVRITRLGRPGPVNSILRRWTYIRHASRHASSTQRPDIIHSHITAGSLAGVRAARRLGVPHLTTVHALLSLDSSMGPERSTPWMHRMLERYILRRPYDRMVALSQMMKRQLMRIGVDEERIVVIPNGVDEALFCPDGPRPANWPFGKDDFVVLFYGRLWPVKGIPVLLDAVARLAPERRNLRLLIIGNGPDEGAIDAHLASGPLKAVARRMPQMPYEELPAYLRAADLFVLPSYSEGVPLSLLEAQSAQLPVLATRVGGVPEIVEHGRTGYLIEPSNTKDLEDGIRYVMDNSKTAEQWSVRARAEVINRNTWASVTKQLLEQYRDLVQE